MPDLPTGTLTFLFTDIESSTLLLQKYPRAMPAAQVRHGSLLREAIEASGGYVFNSAGDGLYAVFDRATDAAIAAVEGQRALQSATWGQTGPIKARMALGTGQADRIDDDYIGVVLNRTTRLMAAGFGGQILLFQTTFNLVRDALPTGAYLRSLGEHQLRDLPRPERIYQLGHPDLPDKFLPLRSLDVLSNSLPQELTSFIGREREMSAIRHLLSTSSLVALTGTGGCGKSRLTLQVAKSLRETFADDVFFVTLDAISDPHRVAAAIGRVVGAETLVGQSAEDSLVAHLRRRHVLLLLDNFEHVVAAAPLVATLLAACPHLKMIVTSRVRLGLRGGRVFEVPPFQLPDPEQLPSPEELQQNEGLRLFAERARNVKPDFEVTAENAAAVVEICRRLDGLPLAIELAAAKINVLTPHVLLQRLVPTLLNRSQRDLDGRQDTLWNTFAWSFNLLKPPEQRLFRQLAVFGGGFSLEAAESVVDPRGLKLDVLDGLDALVGASLVRRADVGSEPRYTMLETIRKFAWEKLLEAGEAEALGRRHAAYYLKLAEAAPPEIWQPRPDHSVLLERLDEEQENIRLALGYVAEAQDAVLSLRWGAALGWFWWRRAYWPGDPQEIDRPRLETRRKHLAQARALFGAGYVAWCRGDDSAADDLFKQSQAARLDVTVEYLADVDHTRRGLELVTRWEQRDALAQSVFGEVLTRHQADADQPRMAWTLLHLGWLAFFRDDGAAAEKLFCEAAGGFDPLEDWLGVAAAHFGRGWIAHGTGDFDAARTHYTVSLKVLRERGEVSLVPYVLGNWVMLAGALGDVELAALLAGATVALQSQADADVPHALVAMLARSLGPIRRAVGDVRYATAFAKGTTLNLDETVNVCLGDE